jgi:hypothetical protein
MQRTDKSDTWFKTRDNNKKRRRKKRKTLAKERWREGGEKDVYTKEVRSMVYRPPIGKVFYRGEKKVFN